MDEIWKTVKDNPRYEVSNYGEVRSLDRYIVRNGKKQLVKGQILKQSLSGNYLRVTLYYGNRTIKRQVFVHRLVAENFVDNPNNYPYINYKDEDKYNNHADNLEWCTAKYNSNYGTAIQRRVKHQDWKSIADKHSVAICQYSMNGQLIKEYKSLSQAEKESDGYFRVSGISRNLTGYLKQYKGYLWKYKNEQKFERGWFHERANVYI